MVEDTKIMSYGTRSGGSGFDLKASLKQWASRWLSGGPHFIVGPRYLLRWYVIPRNPWLNVYLHQFLHDDEDRALHDHLWWFISIMLWGSYMEILPSPGAVWPLRVRNAGSIAYNPATHTHRVKLQEKFAATRINNASKPRGD